MRISLFYEFYGGHLGFIQNVTCYTCKKKWNPIFFSPWSYSEPESVAKSILTSKKSESYFYDKWAYTNHKDTANCLTHAQRRHQSLSLKLPYNNNNVYYTGQPALTSTSRTGGFCWCKVLVPACPCWRHPAHSDYGENAGVLNSVIYTVSVPLSLKSALKYQNVANNVVNKVEQA